MEKSTKIIVGLLIIALIIMGIVLWTSKEEKSEQNNINQINITQNENNLVENKVENLVNETENIVSEDKQDEILNEEAIENSNEDSTNISQITDNQKKEESNNEKAINMVKNDWGEDESVSFKIDEQTEDGKYVISVVDKNTTKVIMWYDVDIKNNTIEEK